MAQSLTHATCDSLFAWLGALLGSSCAHFVPLRGECRSGEGQFASASVCARAGRRPAVNPQRKARGRALHAAWYALCSCTLRGTPTACLLHLPFMHRQTLGHGSAWRQLTRRLRMVRSAARGQVSCCMHVRKEAGYIDIDSTHVPAPWPV